MDDFLRKIANKISQGNVYQAIDFYTALKYVGIKPNNSLGFDIENYYKDFLDSLENSLVKYSTNFLGEGLNRTYYIGFYVDKKADYFDAVKVYFSVKYEYVISALKTVFMYLIRNNIKSTVKFHLKNTNENIVIRFYNKEDVKPFIEYCNSSFILNDLLGPVNPFIATINGIGIVRDDNYVNTYNGTIALMLEEYFALLKEEKRLSLASGVDFLDFLMKRRSLEKEEAMIFNINSLINNIRAIINQSDPLES